MQHDNLLSLTGLTGKQLEIIIEHDRTAPIFGCRICGFLLFDRHHILPKDLNGTDDDDNMIDLCPNHHRAIHMLTAFFLHNAVALEAGREVTYPPRWARQKQWKFDNAVATDDALVAWFHVLFVPKWREAGYPFPQASRMLRQVRGVRAETAA